MCYAQTNEHDFSIYIIIRSTTGYCFPFNASFIRYICPSNIICDENEKYLKFILFWNIFYLKLSSQSHGNIYFIRASNRILGEKSWALSIKKWILYWLEFFSCWKVHCDGEVNRSTSKIFNKSHHTMLFTVHTHFHTPRKISGVGWNLKVWDWTWFVKWNLLNSV